MNAISTLQNTTSYGRIVEASHAVHWEIEDDVIRGRVFDLTRKYLPDGLSLAETFTGLSAPEKTLVSQIQGRTYAKVFGLVERFITAKLLEVGGEHALGNQDALQALVMFSEDELKHQALFRRIDEMMGEVMPEGYRFDIDPDGVARAVLSKRTWAVLLLTLHIELFVQNHYRESIAPDEDLSPLFKDVFKYHWKDECQHVLFDELEIRRHDATLSDEERDQGVDDFIALVGAVDGILQAQAKADTGYFAAACGRPVGAAELASVEAKFLAAYRWQYIFSGAQHPRFGAMVQSLVTPAQWQRMGEALASLT
jgi:hypothetical protein